MSYKIDASLKNGKPCLKIWDVENDSLCLSWTYNDSNSLDKELPQKEVQRLFKKLLLLTIRDDVRNVRVFSVLPVG
jgi:hypothetical protein